MPKFSLSDKTLFGQFDYIIVGAGTAGCVLANRISADPAVSVLLLEAGGEDRSPWIHIPVGYLYCMGNPRTDWCFRTEIESGLNGRVLNYPRGRVLGGCSSINGMIYMRGQARDYDLWAQQGNRGWSWEDVLPYFKRSEDQAILPPGESHGTGGEWRVDAQRLSWKILDAFRDAAAEAGVPKIDDFNTGDNEGCSYFQVNQKYGMRWNASRAFLKPIRIRPNLTIATHAQGLRLLIHESRAVGLEFRRGGDVSGQSDFHAEARHSVILTAGSIGSPHLLQISGIGPTALLRQLNVTVQQNLEGVGNNLQDHLQIRCAYKVSNVQTLNTQSATLLGKARIGLHYLLTRGGPMSMAPSQLGAFAKSDPSYETANLQYHIQPLSLDAFGQPLHSFDAFTASVCNLRPESRGTVRAASSDPMVAPLIRPNYLQTQTDRNVAAASIRLTRKIVRQAALVPYQPQEFKPGPEFSSDDELAHAAGDIGTTIFHPVGTCRMGHDNNSVVDERLRVYGIEGLRVVDASIMPTITSGNTNSPVIMIAEKAADMIRHDRLTGSISRKVPLHNKNKGI